MSEVPKFSIPFTFVGGKALVVEQDSDTDIMQCVRAILRTPQGSRTEAPGFGMPDMTFEIANGAISSAAGKALAQYEPRAHVEITEAPNTIDDLIDNVRVNVYGGEQ